VRHWILTVLAAAALAGCAEPERPWHSRGDRVLGLGSEQAEDPVSGALVEKKESVKRRHRGTTYFFESTETAELFDLNPGFYAIPENLPPEERDREVR
jgi:YHS domain-containing protein